MLYIPFAIEIMSSQAVVYSQNSSFQVEDGLKLMSHLDLQDGMKVLDLVCGTGYLASVLAERVGKTGQVVGIDSDKERIAVAESTHGSIGNLMFKEGSAETITAEGSFDVVFSNYVIHWIQDKKLAFQNVFRCLKPSGTFAVVATLETSPFINSYLNLMEASKLEEYQRNHHSLTTKEIKDIALSCGFSVQYEAEIDCSFVFSSFDQFTQFAYGSTGGLVDTKFMDAENLCKFEKESTVQKGVSISATGFLVFGKND